MPFHYLKTNQPIALIFYAPWAVIAWLPHLLQIGDYQSVNLFPYALIPLETSMEPWLQVALGLVCVTLQAYQFNLIINKAQVLGRETNVHGAMYILAASVMYPHGAINTQLISMFFILPALGKWWSLIEQRQATAVCFDSAFLISIATLLYAPNAVLLLQAFISLMIFRTFNGREALYMLIGFALPLLFWFTLCFSLQWPWLTEWKAWTEYTWNQESYWTTWYIAGGIWMVLSFLHFLSATPQQIIRVRKMRSLILWYLLFSLAAMGVFYMITGRFSFPFIALFPMAAFSSGFIHMPARSGFAVLISYAAWFIFLYASCYGLINSY